MENVVAPKRPKGKGKNMVQRTPASRGVPKKKIAKPKANPFRRSDTGKLQLKRLQMGKRVEMQTPKVAQMRARFELADSRLTAVTAKLKLVEQELASRKEKVAEDEAVEESETSELSDEEEIELDDEVEDEAGGN